MKWLFGLLLHYASSNQGRGCLNYWLKLRFVAVRLAGFLDSLFRFLRFIVFAALGCVLVAVGNPKDQGW